MKIEFHFSLTSQNHDTMKIIFLPGGHLNDLGPFEAGEEINVPADWVPQLIAQGVALPVPNLSAKPLTVTVKLQESGHGDV